MKKDDNIEENKASRNLVDIVISVISIVINLLFYYKLLPENDILNTLACILLIIPIFSFILNLYLIIINIKNNKPMMAIINLVLLIGVSYSIYLFYLSL